MRARILVAYATRAGSTAEVAGVIGQVLRDGGADVDVRPVRQVRDLAGYDALVLGSAIWKDYSAVHPFVRWVMTRMLNSPEGDWRDRDTIRAWAAELAPRLAPTAPALASTG